MYTGQDYMTPGVAQTVGIIADTVQFADNTMLLEVAAGKGSGRRPGRATGQGGGCRVHLP